MKGRGWFTLLAITVLAFGVTGAALAAPPAAPPLNGQETCPEGDGWTKINSDDLSLYPVEGADDYCFKAGQWVIDYVPEGGFGQEGSCNDGPQFCDLSHWAYHLPDEEPEVCEETIAVYGEWSEWAVDPEDESRLVRSRSVTYVDAEDGETVCGEDVEYEYQDRPVCEWDPELYADDPECQPPPGEASATLSPFCGGGINVTVVNATLFVDSQEITANGSYALEPGDYSAYAEAAEGFEFPEGATTQWEFTIEACPTPREEPPTGPLDGIPLSTVLPIAAAGLTGLALLGSALRRKRH